LIWSRKRKTNLTSTGQKSKIDHITSGSRKRSDTKLLNFSTPPKWQKKVPVSVL